ncbi:hypothetical protein [Rhodococcus qingshengii]|uniref:hypothetical protein n=1 Tax=Rhodococcus qingshengii TaxID=334542 RepID=UPI00255226EA|nr:hypothetical protein [Rhodococcus qingshengii]
MGFAPLDDTGTQLLFRLVTGAYERRSLASGVRTGRSSNGAGSSPPSPRFSNDCSTTPPSSSPTADSCHLKGALHRKCASENRKHRHRWGLSPGHQRGHQHGQHLAV